MYILCCVKAKTPKKLKIVVERFGIVFMSWMCLSFSDKFLFQGASQHNRSCAEHWLLFSVCMCTGCCELYICYMLYQFLLKILAMYTLLFQCFRSIWQNKSVQTGTRPQQAWKTQVRIYRCLFQPPCKKVMPSIYYGIVIPVLMSEV